MASVHGHSSLFVLGEKVLLTLSEVTKQTHRDAQHREGKGPSSNSVALKTFLPSLVPEPRAWE